LMYPSGRAFGDCQLIQADPDISPYAEPLRPLHPPPDASGIAICFICTVCADAPKAKVNTRHKAKVRAKVTLRM
jgi:hypothetical protein